MRSPRVVTMRFGSLATALRRLVFMASLPSSDEPTPSPLAIGLPPPAPRIPRACPHGHRRTLPFFSPVPCKGDRGETLMGIAASPMLKEARHAEPALEIARDVPEPEPGAPVRDRDGVPRVHVPVPDDGSARLRHHPPALCPGAALRRAEEPEAVSLELPQRGRVPRGGDEQDLRRPRRGARAALDRGDGRLLRPRRHPHRGRRPARRAAGVLAVVIASLAPPREVFSRPKQSHRAVRAWLAFLSPSSASSQSPIASRAIRLASAIVSASLKQPGSSGTS